jgi:hypothetical protein
VTTPPPAAGRGRYRAGDAERQEALTRLGDHFAEGRLDKEEFDERSTQALGAVYLDELDALFVDLPPRPDPSRRMPAQRTRPRPRTSLGAVAILLLLALVLLLATRGVVLWPLLAFWWFAAGPRGRARRPRGWVSPRP